MNVKQYDAQEEARLVSLADAKETQRQSIAKQMHDVLGRDPDATGVTEEPKVLNTDELMRYKTLELHENELSREVTELRAEIKSISSAKPLDPVVAKEKEESDPFIRWTKKRENGLEDHEIRKQKEVLGEFYKDVVGRKPPGIDQAFAITDILPGGPNRAVITPEADGQNNVQQDTVSQTITYGLHDYGGTLQLCSTIQTPNGNTIEYPLYDDGTTKGQIPTGNNLDAQLKADQTENALASFNTVRIAAYPRNTGYVDLSQFANEDVQWDYGMLIREIFMMRMGRMIENDLTLGSGVEADRRPAGFVTRAGEYAMTVASAGIKWQEINTLQYKIDAMYLRSGPRGLHAFGNTRLSGFIGYVTSRAFMGELSNLADTQNRPLLLPSLTSPDTKMLFGYPVAICQELLPANQVWAANTLPIYFGNFSYMTFRTSGAGLVIEEFYDSATAINNTSRFLGRMRYDSEYLGPYSAYANGVPTAAARAEAFKALKVKVA